MDFEHILAYNTTFYSQTPKSKPRTSPFRLASGATRLRRVGASVVRRGFGGWRTPCSGDLDQLARPAEGAASKTPRSGARLSVTATDLARSKPTAGSAAHAISYLVGGRHRHMDFERFIA